MQHHTQNKQKTPRQPECLNISFLVATPVPKWNQIKAELLAIHKLMKQLRSETEVITTQ